MSRHPDVTSAISERQILHQFSHQQNIAVIQSWSSHTKWHSKQNKKIIVYLQWSQPFADINTGSNTNRTGYMWSTVFWLHDQSDWAKCLFFLELSRYSEARLGLSQRVVSGQRSRDTNWIPMLVPEAIYTVCADCTESRTRIFPERLSGTVC